jgi:hypothetical protein
MAQVDEKHIAFCGLDCTRCGAYIATKENNDVRRREVANQWNKAEWSKKYARKFEPADINCDGCLSDRANDGCVIRKCGSGKGLLNCACCTNYICGKLEEYFRNAPHCKETLDTIKEQIK